jgi:predicted nucleic acid-binding protein
MQISSVVMNASPLICTMKAGIAEILPLLFKDIVVPAAVSREILAKGRTAPKGQIPASYPWIRLIQDFPIAPQVASWDLGQGESQVISYAMGHPDYWAVIDDREARRCAMALHCHYTGTLGVIVLARRRGVIPSIREYLGKLKEAGLYLSDELVDQVCRKAGE